MITDAELASVQGTPAPEPSTGGNGLNAAYQSAFNELLVAQTPQARNAAMVRMEQAALAGPEKTSQNLGQSGNSATASPAYRDALSRAMSAPTGQARAAAVAELENLSLMAADVASATASQQPAGPPEGLEPAQHAGDLALPPDLVPHIADMAGFEAVREAAASVGLPKVVWAECLSQGLENRHLLNAPENVWQAHMDGVIAKLEKIHGAEARPGIVKDGAAFLNVLADADPRLVEASDMMRASPWAVTQAAQLWRAGVRPGRK